MSIIPTPVCAPVLATTEQLAAEAILRSLLGDLDLVAMLASETERLMSCEIAQQSADARKRIPGVIKAWTGGLIMRWLCGDPGKPAILLTTDNTPRRWFGTEVPATGAAGDNPDHIYRNAFIDGRGHYRIRGKLDRARKPAQFGIEVTRGEPGRVAISAAATGGGAKQQVDIVTDKDIRTDAEGWFDIDLRADHEPGANRLVLIEEPLTLVIRDVLSDWRQNPTWLSLQRLDEPGMNFLPYHEVKRRVLASLPDYLTFWSHFPLRFMGGIALNDYKRPVPRDGGWGWLAGMRYALQPDQFIVATLDQGKARYLGIQSCDPWFISPDSQEHSCSLNEPQAVAHAGDLYSFVVGAEDPGVANWIDTGGLHNGILLMRWQDVPPGENVAEQLRELRIVERAELERDYTHLTRIGAAARQRQREEHAREYRLRFEARAD